MLQLQLKQFINTPFLPFYLLYVGSFGSAQEGFRFLPVTGNKAMLRTHYHELDAIFKLSKYMSLVTTFGKEYIKGNNQLNRGDNVDGILGSLANDPVNQEGTLFGLGIDYRISNNTYLYARKRWFNQQDKSFVKDQIKGTETTIELKVFF
jgi:hypothetical protein